MAAPDDQQLQADELPMWVQIVGGLWCLSAALIFVRQIMVEYVTLMSGR